MKSLFFEAAYALLFSELERLDMAAFRAEAPDSGEEGQSEYNTLISHYKAVKAVASQMRALSFESGELPEKLAEALASNEEFLKARDSSAGEKRRDVLVYYGTLAYAEVAAAQLTDGDPMRDGYSLAARHLTKAWTACYPPPPPVEVYRVLGEMSDAVTVLLETYASASNTDGESVCRYFLGGGFFRNADGRRIMPLLQSIPVLAEIYESSDAGERERLAAITFGEAWISVKLIPAMSGAKLDAVLAVRDVLREVRKKLDVYPDITI